MKNQYSIYPRVGFIEAIKNGFKKYINCRDRSRRSEFWFFALFNFIVELIFITLLIVTAKKVKGYYYTYIEFNPYIQILLYLYSLAVICPSLCMTIRRLHDIGNNGSYLLFSFIPIVGVIVLIVFYCFDSLPEENEYGPSPKYYINEQNTTPPIPLVPYQNNNDIQLNVTP